MRLKVLFLSLIALFSASSGHAGAEDLQFTPDDARGLFIKQVVGGEGTVLTMVPLNLEDGTHGEPFVLHEWGDVRIRASRHQTGEPNSVTYTGYYLPPGDYALLRMDTHLIQAMRDIRWSLCYAEFSQVFSVRAGEATAVLAIGPPSLTTWAQYQEYVTMPYWSAGAERFERSMAEARNVSVTAINVGPTAFVDLAGGAPADARDCTPRSFALVHRVEE